MTTAKNEIMNRIESLDGVDSTLEGGVSVPTIRVEYEPDSRGRKETVREVADESGFTFYCVGSLVDILRPTDDETAWKQPRTGKWHLDQDCAGTLPIKTTQQDAQESDLSPCGICARP